MFIFAPPDKRIPLGSLGPSKYSPVSLIPYPRCVREWTDEGCLSPELLEVVVTEHAGCIHYYALWWPPRAAFTSFINIYKFTVLCGHATPLQVASFCRNYSFGTVMATTCFKDANIMLKYSYWLSTYTSSFVEITFQASRLFFGVFNTFRGNEQINHLTTLTTGLARHSECWNYIKAHINHLKVLVICFRYFT